MPGLVKVGFTLKDPELRAAELNNTGAPHPYVVDYEVLVNEPRDIEQKVHRVLSDKREGKEWFRTTSEEAGAAIKTVVGSNAQLENHKRVDRAKSERILRQTQETEKRKIAESARILRQTQETEKRKIAESARILRQTQETEKRKIAEKEREEQRAKASEEASVARMRIEKHRTTLLEELHSTQKQLQELPKVNSRLEWMRYAWFIGMGLFGLVSGGLVGMLWALGITFACWLWVRVEMGKPITKNELESKIEKIQIQLGQRRDPDWRNW